jgi:hypothetical protein
MDTSITLLTRDIVPESISNMQAVYAGDVAVSGENRLSTPYIVSQTYLFRSNDPILFVSFDVYFGKFRMV